MTCFQVLKTASLFILNVLSLHIAVMFSVSLTCTAYDMLVNESEFLTYLIA